MDELQAGVEFALTVLPQSPVLLQLGKTMLNYSALGHDLERMQFITLDNQHRYTLTKNTFDTLCERLASVTIVAQQALYLHQIKLGSQAHVIGHPGYGTATAWDSPAM